MSSGLWVTPEDLGVTVENFPDVDEYNENFAVAQDACEGASQILWALSGRKYHGMYRVVERYLRQPRTDGDIFFMASGVRYTTPASVYVVRPEDYDRRQIRLRGNPARQILHVYNAQTGEEIDPTEYSLWDHEALKFNSSIEFDLDIDYTYGAVVPAMGRRAAQQMAWQFYLLWSGREGECSLPERVTNVNRQGVSWTILDNQDFIDDMRTGIYAVDLFLKSVNPDKARAKSRVFSPDVRRGTRRTVN